MVGMIENGHEYFWHTTVLAYGLDSEEVNSLKAAVKNIKVVNQLDTSAKYNLDIYQSVRWTDIIGVPYFCAFINCDQLSTEEQQDIIDYYLECEEPIPEEHHEYFEDGDIKNPIIYAINCKTEKSEIPKCFIKCGSPFDDQEALRLKVLSNLKDSQGLGQANTNAIRIYRVLEMYKTLKESGTISKKTIDEMIYPDTISNSMFYRDLALIRDIEHGRLIYDKKTKKYRLL